MLPFWDIDASVKEIHRVAAKGAKCVTFPDLPDKLGLPSVHSDHWDPLLSAMEETDMVLAQHFGTGKVTPAELVRSLSGAITKEGGEDVKVVREYCETVAKSRGGLWKEFYAAAKAKLS